jgi:hypothetical protein
VSLSVITGVYIAFEVESLGLNEPPPLVVQNAPAAIPFVIPERTIPETPPQTEVSVPALTIGEGVNVRIRESGTEEQELTGVSVSVILPEVTSLEEGTYAAFKVVSEGTNDPVPEEAHWAIVPIDKVPFNKTDPLAQIAVSFPANAKTELENVTRMVSITGLQIPLFVDSRNNIILPPVVSAVLNVYVAFKESEEGEKIPLPEVDHVPVIVPPEILPFKIVFTLEEHITILFPASTIVGWVIVNMIESATGVQALIGVRVNTTLPFVISVAPGL